jgi:hypothetical protein
VRDRARATYEATQIAYGNGTEVFSNLYVWSYRWLQAERALAETRDDELAALRGHLERTKQWYQIVKPLYDQNARGGESPKFHAAGFYVAEAEFWLVAAGGVAPQ